MGNRYSQERRQSSPSLMRSKTFRRSVDHKIPSSQRLAALTNPNFIKTSPLKKPFTKKRFSMGQILKFMNRLDKEIPEKMESTKPKYHLARKRTGVKSPGDYHSESDFMTEIIDHSLACTKSVLAKKVTRSKEEDHNLRIKRYFHTTVKSCIEDLAKTKDPNSSSPVKGSKEKTRNSMKRLPTPPHKSSLPERVNIFEFKELLKKRKFTSPLEPNENKFFKGVQKVKRVNFLGNLKKKKSNETTSKMIMENSRDSIMSDEKLEEKTMKRKLKFLSEATPVHSTKQTEKPSFSPYMYNTEMTISSDSNVRIDTELSSISKSTLKKFRENSNGSKIGEIKNLRKKDIVVFSSDKKCIMRNERVVRIVDDFFSNSRNENKLK